MIAVRGTNLWVDADPVGGYVVLVGASDPQQLTVPELEQLQALLERARRVVSSGFGNMEPGP